MFLRQGAIHVTPGGEPRYVEEDKEFVRTVTLARAAEAVSYGAIYAGGFIRLHSGTYRTAAEQAMVGVPGLSSTVGKPAPYVFRGLRGQPDNPVRIMGEGGKQTRLVGPGMTVRDAWGTNPTDEDFAFFRFEDCEWIEISGFDVSESWPCFIYLKNCRYVTIRDITARGSNYLIFARGEDCRHILVEKVRWRQDPSSSIWRNVPWFDVKYGAYKHYNGGLVGARDIAGGVVVRGCIVRDVFNAVRLKGKKPGTNQNVEVADNIFERVRDNVVEPENRGRNWWVHGNVIRGAHAWFSLDGVEGGHWFFFDNKGTGLDRPGEPGDPNSGGRVFKFSGLSEEERAKMEPFHVFNNSWRIRGSYIKSGDVVHMRHLGNAIDNRPVEPGEEPRPLTDDDFPLPGIWPDTVVFDCDLCASPLDVRLREAGQERQGSFGRGPLFVKPEKDDFRLRPDVKWDYAPVISLKAGLDWPAPEDWEQRDVPPGVYGQGVHGPAYAHLPWPGEDKTPVEHPRPTQVLRPKAKNLLFRLAFSVALEGHGCGVGLRDGERRVVCPARIEGRFLRFEPPKGWEDAAARAVIELPRDLVGQNGLAVTLWACPDPKVGFRGEAPEPREE